MKKPALYLALIASVLFCSPAPNKPKNLILIIGDGTGPQQIGFLLNFSRLNRIEYFKENPLIIEQFLKEAQTGLMLTHPDDKLVADSASSATQLATGKLSKSEMIGLDSQGNRAETILEKARDRGYLTGLISDTRITHATPASFGAHQRHRSMESSIAADFLDSQPDIMLSAGLSHFLPRASTRDTLSSKLAEMIPAEVRISSKRRDDRNLVEEFQNIGYQTVFSKEQLFKTNKNRILGLFKGSAMPDAIQTKQDQLSQTRNYPTLTEMTQQSLQWFKKHEKPFFLMIEAGQVDWACHNNDAGTLLNQLVAMDEMLKEVFHFVKENPDTLLVMTADHSTGGFGLSYTRSNLPGPEKLPGKYFQNAEYQANYNFGDPEILTKIYNQRHSFQTIMANFDVLPEKQQTAMRLQKLITEGTGYNLEIEAVKRVLATENNLYFKAQHKYLSSKRYPKVFDFKAFYTYGQNTRMPLIGRELAEKQMVTWSTGTHTDTPVFVFAYGPGAQELGGLHHSTEVGKIMQKLIDVH